VLLHKLREAIAILRKEIRLDGIVEMDGMYVGGHVRPANEKEKRVDTRLAENKSGKRRAVITMRERDLKTGRTLSAAAPEERRDIAWHLVKHHVAREAIVCADDHKAYDELRGLNELRRNNHSKAYVTSKAASTNMAESHFSRLRRAEIGIHHRISGKYLDWYAADVAWRDDGRRVEFHLLHRKVLASALGHPISRDMAGYWQRTGKRNTPLVAWNPLDEMVVERR